MTSAPSSLVRASAVGAAAFALVLGLGACSSSSSGGSTTGAEATTGSNDGQACGVHKVGTVTVRTFCGTGTATAKGGGVNVSLQKASCETSKDYIAVNAGTVVLGADDAAAAVKESTQYIGLTVGKVPGDTMNKPASSDGSYGGGILAVNDKGRTLLPNAKTLKVTLTENRTAGSFTASLVAGGTVSGTFTCG